MDSVNSSNTLLSNSPNNGSDSARSGTLCDHASLPLYRDPGALFWVFWGGALGTFLRVSFTWISQFLFAQNYYFPEYISDPGQPLTPTMVGLYATFIVNIVGAFLLGLLNGALCFRDTTRISCKHFANKTQERAYSYSNYRLFFGTGMCGGFTTYSTLMWGSWVELNGLTLTDPPYSNVNISLIYGVLTLTVGVTSAWLGTLLGTRHSSGSKPSKESESAHGTVHESAPESPHNLLGTQQLANAPCTDTQQAENSDVSNTQQSKNTPGTQQLANAPGTHQVENPPISDSFHNRDNSEGANS